MKTTTVSNWTITILAFSVLLQAINNIKQDKQIDSLVDHVAAYKKQMEQVEQKLQK